MKRASFVCIVLLAFASSCSSDSPTTPGENPGGNGGNNGGDNGGGGTSAIDTVLVDGNSFSPANLTVASGRTVVWVKRDNGTTHTITPDGHSAFSRVSSSGTGEMLRVTFTTAGNFDYLCEPHLALGMVGSVTVQ